MSRGYPSLSAFVRDLPRPVLTGGQKKTIRSGVLALTDPERAEQAVALLAVDTELGSLLVSEGALARLNV